MRFARTPPPAIILARSARELFEARWARREPLGGSAALYGGLLHAASRYPLPVRLFEIGASAGLNLFADRFRYLDDTGRPWGDTGSSVGAAAEHSGRV